MNKIIKFLLPNRRDLPAILVCFFIVNAIVIPELVLQLKAFSSGPITLLEILPCFFPVLVMTVSVAASLATFSRAQLSAGWRWIAAMFVAWFLFGWLLYRESLLFENVMTNGEIFSGTLKIWLVQPVLFGLTWSLSYGVRKLSIVFSRTRPSNNVSHQRELIIAAVLLFFISTLGRLMHGIDLIGLWSSIGDNWTQILISLFGCVALLGVVPSQINERSRGWRSLPLLLIYFASLVATLPIFFGHDSLYFSIPITILTTVVLGGLKFYREQLNPLKPSGSRSVLTAICVSLTIAMLGISYFFSLSTLRHGGPNCFQIARHVKQLNTLPDVTGVAVADANRVSVELRFKPGADPNILEKLGQSGNYDYLSLQHLTPQIETNYLAGTSVRFCSILDSELTAQQMSDLLSGSSFVAISNCRFVSTDQRHVISTRVASAARFHISNLAAGELTNFLNAVDPKKFSGPVLIFGTNEFSDGDWKMIIVSSLRFPIDLQLLPTPEGLDQFVNCFEPKSSNQKDSNTYQLSINLRGASDAELIRLILDTPIYPRSGFSIADNALQLTMDTLFATKSSYIHSSFVDQIATKITKQSSTWNDAIRQFHWTFDLRDPNDCKGLFLPLVGDFFLDEIVRLTDLEMLSLEDRWLPALRDFRNDKRPQDLNLTRLAKLTQLRRLDLPSGIFTTKLSFLKSMPKLKHLQIDLFGDGTSKPQFDFDAEYCPNLETLVVIGRPSAAVAKEIAKLPKLNSLTIVDIAGTLTGPLKAADRQTFSSVIGDKIAIEFVANDDFFPVTPQEFQQHLERIREHLRKKYLDQSVPVADDLSE